MKPLPASTEPGFGIALALFLGWQFLVATATWLLILQPAVAQFEGADAVETSVEQAIGSPFPPELLAVDAQGRIDDAGPLHTAMFCGAGSTLADAVHSGSIKALVLPSSCLCMEHLFRSSEADRRQATGAVSGRLRSVDRLT